MTDVINSPAFQASLNHLRQLNSQANNGRGVGCVRGVIATIERGDLVGALRWYQLDSDKLRGYPKIQSYMREFLGDPYSDDFDQYLDELQGNDK